MTPKLIVGCKRIIFETEDHLFAYLVNTNNLEKIRIISDNSILLYFRLGKFDNYMEKPPIRLFFKDWDWLDYIQGYAR